MIKKITLILCTALLFFLSMGYSQEINLLRFPAINSNGSQVSFSYQGDIWIASSQGGTARRLTIHEAYDASPEWSPNGKEIVFTSTRFGNSDIFTMPVEGGRPNRITYYSGSDGAPKWMGNDQIIFSSRRMFAQVEREWEVMQVAANGGTPKRYLNALGLSPVPSPSGRYIALVRGTCRFTREAYRGPANRDIWVYDTQTDQYFQITTDEGQDTHPDWGDDNTLYFLSAESGRYNLYQQKLENGNKVGKAKKLTKFSKEGIRNFDVSADGSTAILAYETDLHLLDIKKGGKPKKLRFDLTNDYRFDLVETKRFSTNANSINLSPDGKYLLFGIRGDIYVRPTKKDKNRAKQISKHVARDRRAAWLSDSCAIFISDRNGNNDLFLVKSSDTSEHILYKTLKQEIKAITRTPEDENNFVLSPDRKQIAILKGRGKLVIADIDGQGTLSNERTLLDGWATPSGLSWSPDNKWVAYGLSNLDFNQEIFIHAADNSKAPVNVSLHPKTDNTPVWSEDGSKLGFLSNRNNGDTDVWFVWLNKKDWEKTRREWEDEDDKKPAKKDSSFVVEIDFEDIHERMQQVTRRPGNESTLAISHDGETFYFSTNRGGRQGFEGRPSFYSIKWDGTEEKTLLKNRTFRQLVWEGKGKFMYTIDNLGKLGKFTPASLPRLSMVYINFPFPSQTSWRNVKGSLCIP